MPVATFCLQRPFGLSFGPAAEGGSEPSLRRTRRVLHTTRLQTEMMDLASELRGAGQFDQADGIAQRLVRAGVVLCDEGGDTSWSYGASV